MQPRGARRNHIPSCRARRECSERAGLGGLVVCAALLAAGSALLYPFEMDTLVRLSGQRLMAP